MVNQKKTFKCKGPNCNLEVSYEYDPVEAIVQIPKNLESEVAYLTCEDGHTHPYTI